MGGVHVQCGSFSGGDKSCSAIEAVLSDLRDCASAADLDVIARITAMLDVASDHIIVDTTDAEALLRAVSRYRAALAATMAPIADPFEQMALDLQADPGLDATEAKYGKGLGWKYYCALDLERALVVSARDAEPVILVWD